MDGRTRLAVVVACGVMVFVATVAQSMNQGHGLGVALLLALVFVVTVVVMFALIYGTVFLIARTVRARRRD